MTDREQGSLELDVGASREAARGLLGATTTATSLVLDDDLSLERAGEIGAVLGMIQRASSWWVGDYVIECERLFGHGAAQVASEVNMDEHTMLAWSMTCAKIPREHRDEAISFSTYIDLVSAVLLRGSGTLEDVLAIVERLTAYRLDHGRNMGHKDVRRLLSQHGWEQVALGEAPMTVEDEVRTLRLANTALETELEDLRVLAGSHVRCPRCGQVHAEAEARVGSVQEAMPL